MLVSLLGLCIFPVLPVIFRFYWWSENLGLGFFPIFFGLSFRWNWFRGSSPRINKSSLVHNKCRLRSICPILLWSLNTTYCKGKLLLIGNCFKILNFMLLESCVLMSFPSFFVPPFVYVCLVLTERNANCVYADFVCWRQC